MMNNALRRNPAKNDKRKTAKAVTPLRSIENLFLLCRNLTSTCGVESPLVLARIFLTGYPSLYIVYENRNCYLQAIKIPPNLKQVWRVFVKSFGHSNTAHQIAVFFNLVDVSTYGSIKRKADKLWFLTRSSALHLMCLALWWLLLVNSSLQSMFPACILGSREDNFSEQYPP